MNARKKEVKTVNGNPPKTVMDSKQNEFYNSLIHNSYPVSILADSNINALDRELLSVIFSMIFNTGKFFQSNGTIADELGVSKRTVISSLQRLKENKYISYAYFKKNGRMRRYITSINYDKLKALNKKMEKDNGINTISSYKSSKPIKAKTSKHKSHQSYNANKYSKKPLTTSQKQQINKAIHIISRNVTSCNPKYLKNHFIDEYQHGNLNFNNLDDALTIYQYNKKNNKSIPKDVGYICAITVSNINKSKVNEMMKENKKHQNSQKNSKYLINGKSFLKANFQTFKKDIRHRLKEEKITKKQYHYYRDEYYKHGNRYGDWFY